MQDIAVIVLKKKTEQDLLEIFFTKTSSALEISYESTDTPCPRTFDLAPIRTAITVLNETKKKSDDQRSPKTQKQILNGY